MSSNLKILVFDNYDSFTYNLVHLIEKILHYKVEVHRNDQIPCAEIEARKPSHIIVSPGPCTPSEAGISVECIQRFMGRIPILGVCLGHQSIGQATGGVIERAKRLMHGKTDRIEHDGQGIFQGLPNPLTATRYHSLVIRPGTLHSDFVISAWAGAPDGSKEIMAIRHKTLPVVGVQFHPESFLTQHGHDMLRAFLAMKL